MAIKYNSAPTTIEHIAARYRPEIWDTFEQITNLSDETVGYYAYLLQEILAEGGRISGDNNEAVLKEIQALKALENPEVLVTSPLTKHTCAMENITVSYKHNPPTQGLNMDLHLYDLFFTAWVNHVGHPVVLRNGYLLKCLNEAGIKTFEELENYNAVVIYNHAKVNPHICSFVKFEKKTT